MISRKQNFLYWREWNECHKASPASDRHELHIEALGRDKSHYDLTNRELDKVLGVFRAISDPGNLNAQLRQLNQERNRLRYGIKKQAREIAARDGRPFGADSYIYGIVKRMNAEGQLGSSNFDALGPDELRKVRIALTQHERRAAGRIYQLRSEAKILSKKYFNRRRLCGKQRV